MEQQLLIFKENQEERLEREMKSLREQSEKVRKKLFAENGKLRKMYEDLHHDHEMWKSSVCKSRN